MEFGGYGPTKAPVCTTDDIYTGAECTTVDWNIIFKRKDLLERKVENDANWQAK